MIEALTALMRMVGNEPIQVLKAGKHAYGRTKDNAYYELWQEWEYRGSWTFHRCYSVPLEVASAMAVTEMLPHQSEDKLRAGGIRKFLGGIAS